jgi:hypothetical protein
MGTKLSRSDVAALADLRETLLSGRPAALAPAQGDEAFQQHKLLTSSVHRAARLNAYGSEGETRAWIRYMTEFFPAGRNGNAEAELLWKEWRTSLLKSGAPGTAILVTHGQPHAHWQRDTQGRLIINLESMWGDFESSVDQFISSIRNDPQRREIALKRREKQRWAVESVQFVSLSTSELPVTGATALGSATVGRIRSN